LKTTIILRNDLSLPVRTVGRNFIPEIAQAQIIFLDLFLGSHEDSSAVERALGRVKDVVIKRRMAPPIVILMSASRRLTELGPTVRDGAELLGCQFRMMRKSELGDADATLEKMYELVISYPDSLRLNTFVEAWDKGLENARKEFLRTIRTLDLADYANMQALILDAEGQPVGDYVIDLYDLYLHNIIEGDKDLIRAAKGLNAIVWNEYPPAQFMPSVEGGDIMDGVIFHNEIRTETETELDTGSKLIRLGDVFLANAPRDGAPIPAVAVTEEHVRPGDQVSEATTVAQPEANDQHANAELVPTAGLRHVFVVLSQACDLLHGDTDRALMLRGEAKPYDWKQHDNKKQVPRTPLMKSGGHKFVIEWDLLAPEAWPLDDLPRFLGERGYRLVRRFRTPFALQLQQEFIGRLGRVGTLAALPARYPAAVKIFIRNAQRRALLVAETGLGQEDAVCLVGRTKRNQLKEWLLLSERFLKQLREALLTVAGDLSPLPRQLVDAIRDPKFYRRLKSGLQLAREKQRGSRPFEEPFNLVQVLTRPTLQAGMEMDNEYLPIVIEVEVD
jgi:hypothetical protein